MKKFWNWKTRTVTNQETEAPIQERTLYLNGTIADESWFDDDVTPQLFKDELNSGTGDITVWINSPGGDCVAAAQIYNMLMDYKGNVTVKIDGLAASAASVIAMAGTKVLVSPVSMMMIHNPATIAMGDSAEMQKAIYRCNHKYDNGTKCETSHVTEEEVKVAFVSAYNKLVTEKKEIIANAEIIRKTLCVTDSLLAEKKQLEDEMSIVVEMTQSIVEENARVAQNQEEYQKRYNALVARYDESKTRYDEVTVAISAKEAQGEQLKNFIQTLKTQDGTIREFDSALWGSMVEYVTVGRKKEITVTFRNGTEIQA